MTKSPIRIKRPGANVERQAPDHLSADQIDQLATNITSIVKAESQILTNALEQEDGFVNDYGDHIVAPELNPEILASFVEQNDALAQCIAAMEVNVDGTGYEICRADKQPLTDADREEIGKHQEFLDEVYPTMSLTTLRRKVRRHKESVGYGCIEVMRNTAGEIVFLRPLDSKSIRLCKLQKAVPVKKKLVRGGEEATFTIQQRQRRFVQKVNNKKVYFKEYGTTRDLDKKTGEWSDQKLPSGKRASEILYLMVNKSVKTPYGYPRWINQLPSVMGSRMAEELNLEYFGSGGIPPIMVFIAGGAMGEEARKHINSLLKGKAKDKLRGLVADIHSTSGTVEKGGGVDVKVETFDSARQQDSMFENYDDRCEKRVRSSFRLPPLFVGKADDYSFASVYASYTLAEAQVFKPEREEFDELFNATIMRELTGGKYKIKSNPLTVSDITNKLKGLELAAKYRVVTENQLREGLNMAADLSIPIKEQDEELQAPILTPLGHQRNPPGEPPTPKPVVTGQAAQRPAVSKADLSHLADIAQDYATLLMTDASSSDWEEMEQIMKGLDDMERNMVDMLASARVFAVTYNDSAGITELFGCVTETEH